MNLVKLTVKGRDALVAAFCKGVNAVVTFVKSVVAVFAPVKRVAFAIATLFVGVVAASAQSSGGTTFADPSTITTTATTVFTAVATLMVGIVGFWVVLKIVRKISGK